MLFKRPARWRRGFSDTFRGHGRRLEVRRKVQDRHYLESHAVPSTDLDRR